MTAYQSRSFSYHGVRESGDIALKTYAIEGRAPLQTSTLQLAWSSAEQLIGDSRRRETDRPTPGYAIVHRGEMNTWLLAHWWDYGDIVMARLATLSTQGDRFAVTEDEHFHACVWEAVVIHHERDAWVRHMLRDTPSLPRYLADSLASGAY